MFALSIHLLTNSTATSQVTLSVASSSSSAHASSAVTSTGPPEFASFVNAVNNLPEIRPQELLTPDEAQTVVPRMSKDSHILRFKS